MIKNNLNLREIISEAWNKTKKNYWFLFCLLIASFIISSAIHHIFLLNYILDIFIGVAVLTIAILIADGNTPKYEDIFKSFKNYKITLNFFLASILCMITIIAGLIVFILPGIYLAVRLQFYKFLVIENENMSPIDALKESYKMTEGHFWYLLNFIVVILVINLIGAIPFGLGFVVTLPLSLISGAVLYKKLLPHHIHH